WTPSVPLFQNRHFITRRLGNRGRGRSSGRDAFASSCRRTAPRLRFENRRGIRSMDMEKNFSGLRRARAALRSGVAFLLLLGAGLPAAGQDSLTLEAALARAGNHPALIARDLEARALDAAARQSG